MIPVIIPANAPAANEITKVKTGFTPTIIKLTVTAAPSGNVPSTERSGKSKILYVIYTPSAMIA